MHIIDLLMKKIAAIVSSLGFLATAQSAFADIIIRITPPSQSIPAQSGDISLMITNAIKIIFVVALLLVLIMLIIGAVQWIVSGGDKEAVGKARGRIIAALVGLVILALAFLIASVAGTILGIGSILNFTIPTLLSP